MPEEDGPLCQAEGCERPAFHRGAHSGPANPEKGGAPGAGDGVYHDAPFLKKYGA